MQKSGDLWNLHYLHFLVLFQDGIILTLSLFYARQSSDMVLTLFIREFLFFFFVILLFLKYFESINWLNDTLLVGFTNFR